MRPTMITTHVNIMIAGSTHHVGKVPYYKLEKETMTTAAETPKDTTQHEDPKSAQEL